MRVTSANKRFQLVTILILSVVLLLPIIAQRVLATTITMLEGQVSLTDTLNTIKSTNGTVTATAKGSLLGKKNNTITITNETDSAATLTFDYTVDKASSFSIDGNSAAASGTYSKLLVAGQSVTFVITSNSGFSNLTVTLTLSNFSLVAADAESTVTLGSFNASLGTATVGGGLSAKGNINSGVALVATPNTGVSCLGWVNAETGEVVGTSASFTYYPTNNITVIPAFASASTDAWFSTNGGSHLFNNLNTATTVASSSTNKTVVLAANGTLKAGNYTIPAGVTLNIPYNAAGTLCTTEPTKHENKYTKPSVFRKLTLASGANITVNGTLSVSGMQSTQKRNNGSPSGPVGFISMNSNSSIAVNEGALLYVWGYITGSGSVIINSGGTLYESFQITDYRGGDATTEITSKDDEYGVFPFNQYYVQNVEVPLSIHAGANEYCTSFVTVSLGLGNYMYQPLNVPFIGEEGTMFTLDSGYLVKDYIEGTGRTEIKVFGNMSIQEVSLSMKVSMFGDITIDSSKYALPIPNHMTVILSSGNLSLNQSMALLPGSELYVEEGTKATLGAGKKVYIYDWAQWNYNDGANGYSGTTNLPYIALNYVPGGDGVEGRLKDALVQVDGIVDATKGAIYVTSGGANVYSTGTGVIKLTAGTETVAYQVITSGTDISSWPEITLLPAVLRDAGDTYVSANVAGEYKYYAATGKWDSPDHRYEAVVTAPTCTEKGYTANVCIACKIDGDHYNETAALGHADCKNANGEEASDHFCDHCHLIMYYATNVRLGNSLDMMFAFPNVFTDHPDSYYIKIVRHYAGGTAKEETYSYANEQWTVTTGYIYFTYTGLSAKEMCDKIEVTLCTANGDAISVTWVDSIRDYAIRLLDKHKDNEPLRTLLVDMLNYGAACQNYFGYGKDDLANALLNETQKDYASAEKEYSASNVDRPGWKASQLVVESNIRYNIVFAETITHNGETLNTEDLFVRYTYTGHKGNTVIGNLEDIGTLGTVEIDGTKYRCLTIAKMVVADAAETDFAITVTITDIGESTVYAQWTDSIKDYTARQTDTDPVYGLFMQFAESAYTYLHSEERIE